MPRKLPDPWPSTEQEVREWRINDGYDFFLERLELPEKLFQEHHASLDGITLTTVVLGALADYYAAYAEAALGYKKNPSAPNRTNFTRLIKNFVPSVIDRISTPELARISRNPRKQIHSIHAALVKKYPLPELSMFRPIDADPKVSEFQTWLLSECPTMSPKAVEDAIGKFCHTGLLFDYYRNSVMHGLRVAWGREAYPDPPRFWAGDSESIFFYQHHSVEKPVDEFDEVRFGVRPVALLSLAKEIIKNMRTWAHANDVHLFDE